MDYLIVLCLIAIAIISLGFLAWTFFYKTLKTMEGEEDMDIAVYLENGAKTPTKAHDLDAGFDLYAPKTMSSTGMYWNDTMVIDTKVHMIIPDGYCGLIVSKSGLNINHGITVTGLVDAGYEGSIKIKLYRHEDSDKNPYVIEPEDKIAQIMILPVPEVNLVLKNISELEYCSERGSNGFGSTGR